MTAQKPRRKQLFPVISGPLSLDSPYHIPENMSVESTFKLGSA